MRIGINTRFLLSSKMEGFGWYTFEVVKRMVLAHPEHEFVFFFDRAFDPKFIFAENVKPVVLFPPARHPFLFIWYFDFALKKALKREQIDVFFSPDGYLALGSDVPQVAVIHDLNFEHYPEDIPSLPRWYLRKYFPKFAKKAANILTVSEYSKQDIVNTYGIEPQKISVAWNGAAPAFQPLTTEQQLATRDRFSNGKPYFIFVGSIHPRKNVGRLIAAFEAFCKTNPSIDLLIVGTNMWKNGQSAIPTVSKEVEERIHFTGHVDLNVLSELMGAAFALSYVPYFEGFGIPLVEAMRCGIPIISGNLTSLPEVAGEAALYVDPFNVEAITNAMLQLANDENLQRELSQKSLERGQLFSWDHTAEGAWKTILKAAEKADKS